MTRALLVLAVALAVVVGCFSTTLPNGTIACSDDPTRPCPSGYSCVGGKCWLQSSLDDGGSSDGGGD